MHIQYLLHLCHVCKGEFGCWVLLVGLDNFQKLCLPLHRHFELGLVASVVVEGEGQDESLRVGEVVIWKKQEDKYTSEPPFLS